MPSGQLNPSELRHEVEEKLLAWSLDKILIRANRLPERENSAIIRPQAVVLSVEFSVSSPLRR
jgi:hypothetical protein